MVKYELRNLWMSRKVLDFELEVVCVGWRSLLSHSTSQPLSYPLYKEIGNSDFTDIFIIEW